MNWAIFFCNCNFLFSLPWPSSSSLYLLLYHAAILLHLQGQENSMADLKKNGLDRTLVKHPYSFEICIWLWLGVWNLEITCQAKGWLLIQWPSNWNDNFYGKKGTIQAVFLHPVIGVCHEIFTMWEDCPKVYHVLADLENSIWPQRVFKKKSDVDNVEPKEKRCHTLRIMLPDDDETLLKSFC